MSTEQPINPQAVEETKAQIRGLVNEIAVLTRQEIEPAVYYGEFLQRVITALAAVGGAIWVLRGSSALELAYQINLRETFPDDDGEDRARHARLLQRVLYHGEQLLVPPYSGAGGDDEAGNPTSYLLVLAPIRDDEKITGVVEIFQRPTSGPASQRGYLRFLVEMCQHIGDYLRGRRLRELTDWQSMFKQVDRFSRMCHESLDPKTTAYVISNEGRRLIGCDRVSVALRKGQRCTISAVSGQDTMDTRANSVVLLGKLATAVMRSGEPLWYTGDTEDLPPQIEDAVHNYVDETHTKTVAVLPLRRPSQEVPDGDDTKRRQQRDQDEDGEVIATLVVEQIEDSRPPEVFAQRVELVREHSACALANAVDHHNLFLMPLWKAIGNAGWVLRARTLPKTLAVLAVVLAAIAALVFVPWDFEMEAKGKLLPQVRRDVFVEVDGTVNAVEVKHADQVSQGDKLVVLENFDLFAERERILGDLLTNQKRLQSVAVLRNDPNLKPEEKNSYAGEVHQLNTKIRGLMKQIEVLDQQIEGLTITSPINGEVNTFDVRDLLIHRPVSRGEVLMTIADPNDDWELEVFMEEDRMGHVAKALEENNGELPVRFILKSDARDEYQGTLLRENVHDSAQLHDQYGQSVRLIINFDKSDLAQLRYGTEVTVKVNCGQRSIGYCWFHELLEFMRTHIFF